MRAALPLTAAALLLGACNVNADARQDSGNHQNIRRNFSVADFSKVALAGSPDVVVAVGGAPSVRAEGDKSIIDRLDIRVENGELRIGTKPQAGWSWNFGGVHSSKVTIFVTAPSLAAAAVAGSGDMKIDKVAGNDFNGTIGGSGDLELASLQVAQAHLSVVGSGDLRAAGRAQQATLSVAGSGNLVAGGFEVANATVSVVGSGDVTAHATQTADISIAGSGDANLTGSAKCSVHKLGSGNAHCGG